MRYHSWVLLLAQPATPWRIASRGIIRRANSAHMSSSFHTTFRQVAELDDSHALLLDAGRLPDSEVKVLVPHITEVANWAYRGKYADVDERAWTGERHLISGIRTSNDVVQSMFSSARARGPEHEMLILAARRPDDSASTMSPRLLGTIHAKRTGADDGVAAEFGFFAVDPDVQGEGIGSLLLASAERHAKDTMGVEHATLWVISVRADLIRYYERRGYSRTEETAPFPPPSAGVGIAKRSDLEFVRLVKLLPSS